MKVYKILEVSEILKVHPNTVKAEIQRGKLKASKVGTEWRVSETFLENYMGIVGNDYKTSRELELEEKVNILTKENNRYKKLFSEIGSIVIESTQN